MSIRTQEQTTLKAWNDKVSVVLTPTALMIHQLDDNDMIESSVCLSPSDIQDLKAMVNFIESKA